MKIIIFKTLCVCHNLELNIPYGVGHSRVIFNGLRTFRFSSYHGLISMHSLPHVFLIQTCSDRWSLMRKKAQTDVSHLQLTYVLRILSGWKLTQIRMTCLTLHQSAASLVEISSKDPKPTKAQLHILDNVK